jgi:uncharacterized protein
VGKLIHPDGERTFEAHFASSLWQRVRGLIGRPPMVIVIPSKGQVHTLGMRYPIDVFFCDPSWRVLRVVHELQPRRMTSYVAGTRYVIEAPAGMIPTAEVGARFSYLSRSKTDR